MRKNIIDFSNFDSIKNTFEEIIHTQIPVVKDMGIELSGFNGTEIKLKAPLDKNINHRFSAFGGSIYSVAVLAVYGLVFLNLRKRNLNPHIVVHKSNVVYKAPILQDFEAVCKIEKDKEFDDFIQYYIENKKSRIELSSNVIIDGQIAFTLNAKFVIYD